MYKQILLIFLIRITMVLPEHRRANHLRRLGNSRPEASEPKPDILNPETPDPIAKTPKSKSMRLILKPSRMSNDAALSVHVLIQLIMCPKVNENHAWPKYLWVFKVLRFEGLEVEGVEGEGVIFSPCSETLVPFHAVK